MKKNFINKLETGQILNNEIFLVKEFKKLKASNNKEYWSLKLSDKTGEIDAKAWEDNLADCQQCKRGDAILINGKIDKFKGKKQIIAENILIAEKFDIADFIAKTSKDIDKLFKICEKSIEKIDDKFIKKLLNKFFQDKKFIEQIKNAPGAEKIHHAYIGGLIEHITEMLNLSENIIKDYPNINQDLLTCGILLHDIGKIDELSVNSGISRSMEGKFIGHLTIGTIRIAKQIDKIENFPEQLKNKILHLILSHHGKLEFGSPIKPLLLEAIVLYYLDELSSKTNIAAKLHEIGKDSAELFSDRHFALDNTKIYIGNDEQDDKQPKLI